jgi:hypothetical protein
MTKLYDCTQVFVRGVVLLFWIQEHPYSLARQYVLPSFLQLDYSQKNSRPDFTLLCFFFQSIVTEVNHAIGAEGIVSTECKQVVSQYGDLIWNLLISGVGFFFIFNVI